MQQDPPIRYILTTSSMCKKMSLKSIFPKICDMQQNPRHSIIQTTFSPSSENDVSEIDIPQECTTCNRTILSHSRARDKITVLDISKTSSCIEMYREVLGLTVRQRYATRNILSNERVRSKTCLRSMSLLGMSLNRVRLISTCRIQVRKAIFGSPIRETTY